MTLGPHTALKRDHESLLGTPHSHLNKEGVWICNKTGKPIDYVVVPRSARDGVESVVHLFCSGCNPDFKPPASFSPVCEGELITVL